MLTALIVPLMLATAAPAAAPPARCEVAHPATCRDTNVLVHTPGLKVAMAAFLGKHATDRVSYLTANGKLIDQLNEVLGGPPDERRDLPGGGSLFTACRAHSCTEKGAIAVNADGQIKAVGILNFHCGPGPASCAPGAVLDVFVRAEDAPVRAATTAMNDWATAAMKGAGAVGTPHPFEGMVVHRLAGGRG